MPKSINLRPRHRWGKTDGFKMETQCFKCYGALPEDKEYFIRISQDLAHKEYAMRTDYLTLRFCSSECMHAFRTAYNRKSALETAVSNEKPI